MCCLLWLSLLLLPLLWLQLRFGIEVADAFAVAVAVAPVVVSDVVAHNVSLGVTKTPD